jgi:TRAP-type C4-dicarboxylate transport system substrate-binding protein
MTVRSRIAAAALCGLLVSCAGEDGVRLIKLGHGLPTSHPVHEAMTFLAERAAEKSNGALRIDIHSNEQLGTERECIELLQIGSLGMSKVSASVLEGFVPVYAVFSLPYIFRDEEHRMSVFDAEVGKRIVIAGEPFGLRGLTYYDAGSRSFYTKERPIERPLQKFDTVRSFTRHSSEPPGYTLS